MPFSLARTCRALLVLCCVATASCGDDVTHEGTPQPEIPHVAVSPDEVRERARRLVVNVAREGSVYFRNFEFDLDSGDPRERPDAIDALRGEIQTLASRAARAPTCVVVIYDAGTPPQHLTWIFQALEQIDDTDITFRARPRAKGGGPR